MGENPSGRLTAKEELFCREYLACHFNAKQAALKAGYSERSAYTIGWRLTISPRVQQRIEELKAQYLKRHQIDDFYILTTLREIIERGMQRKTDKDGNVIKSIYDPHAVRLAIREIGMWLGKYKQRHEFSGPDGAPIPIDLGNKSDAEIEQETLEIFIRHGIVTQQPDGTYAFNTQPTTGSDTPAPAGSTGASPRKRRTAAGARTGS